MHSFSVAKAVSLNALLALLLSGGSAEAQNPPGENSQPERVVVTVLRRDTLLDETAASVTALDRNTLEQSGIRNTSELGAVVPGLSVVDSGNSYRRFALRGVQGTGESTVGIYYDEVPLGGSVGSSSDSGGTMPALELFDVERIEVARGPQGTLFGSSSMGGAIRVMFRKPEFQPGASFSIGSATTSGGSASTLLQGIGNLPVIEDRLALRIGLSRRDRGGYIDAPGLNRSDFDDTLTETGRLSVRFLPTDEITVDFSSHYEKSDGKRSLWIREAGAFQTSQRALPAVKDSVSLHSISIRTYTSLGELTATASHSERDFDSVSRDTTAFLETFVDNENACAGVWNSGAPCSPSDLSAFNSYVNGYIPSALYPRQANDAGTLEIRFTSGNLGRWTWTIGSYFSQRDTAVDNVAVGFNSANGEPTNPPPLYFRRLINDRLTERALFGEASFQVTDRLSVAFGLRVFDFYRSVSGETPLALPLIRTVVTPFDRLSSSENSSVSRLALSYQLNPDVFLFGNVAEGYRAGGVNQVFGLPDALEPYLSDSLVSTEAGIKIALPDRRASFSASVYRIDWDNMQVTGTTPDDVFRFISNAGDARNDGFELEAHVRFTNRLSLQGNLEWSDARLGADQNNASIVAPGRAGDRIPYIPQRTATAGIEYGYLQAGSWLFFSRLDIAYRDEAPSELRPDDPFYRVVPSSVIANLTLGFDKPEQNTEIRLFIRNLADRLAPAWTGSDFSTLGDTLVVAAPPRTIGVSISKSY